MAVDSSQLYEFGPFRLDPANRLLARNGETVHLSPKAFDMLVVLIENRGRLMGKDELLRRVWPDAFVEEGNLSVTIFSLRKALGDGTDGDQFIVTVQRRGYRFIAEIRVRARSAGERRPVWRRMRTWFGIAITLVLAGLSFGIYRRVTPSAPFQRFRIERIGTGTSPILGPAISPDGRFLVYAAREDGTWGLRIRQVATDAERWLVTPLERGFFGTTFSADGNFIYFNISEGNNRRAVHVVPVLGGAPRKLVDDVGLSVAASPDGRQLAFTRSNATETSVLIANADGTHEKRVAVRRQPEFISEPLAWSPDGAMIACTAAGPSGMNVVAVPTAGGPEKLIRSRKWADISGIVWLASGRGIALLASELASTTAIWHLTYPGGAAHRISSDVLGYYHGLSATADGATLALLKVEDLYDIWLAPGDDASHAVQLRPSGGPDVGRNGISWTPDGQIVYASSISGRSEIWICRMDGTHRKQLTGTQNSSEPKVSPDGRRIAYLSDRAVHPQIWSMSIDGGDQRQLTTGAEPKHGFAWSHDGNWIVYTTGLEVWRISKDGGPPVSLAATGDQYACCPSVSPDDSMIAILTFDRLGNDAARIQTLPFQGGALTKRFHEATLWPVEWNSDGKAVMFASNQNGDLWIRPLSGGPAERVTDMKSGHIVRFELSHNRSYLAFARGVWHNEVLLVHDLDATSAQPSGRN